MASVGQNALRRCAHWPDWTTTHFSIQVLTQIDQSRADRLRRPETSTRWTYPKSKYNKGDSAGYSTKQVIKISYGGERKRKEGKRALAVAPDYSTSIEEKSHACILGPIYMHTLNNLIFIRVHLKSAYYIDRLYNGYKWYGISLITNIRLFYL
jgi:hypothetical protein